MVKVRKYTIAVVAFALVLAAFNSFAFAQSSTPSVPVKIGIMAPITGDAASIGTEQLDWAQLAVDDFNKATGWNVELVQGDTQLDPAIAVTVGQSMIADKDIYGVVGPAGSQEVENTEQAFKDARLVQVSGSATRPSLTTTGFDTFFRTVPTDDVQGPTDGNFIYNTLGATQLYVIDDKTSYSTGLADAASKAFEAAGGKVVAREEVDQKDTDFSTLATKIGASGATVVFFPGQIASQGALLAKALQEQNLKVIVFGGDGFLNVSDFITGAAGATDGDYVSNFAPDIRGVATSADAVKEYTDQYNADFTAFGPPSYAAATVILEAIQRANDAGTLTREAVRDEVAKTNQDVSILGTPLSFDQNGDVQGAQFYIYQVKDGNFVSVPTGAMPEATMEATMEMTPESTPSG
jgi:branched-chain amino acid transport system substrate-binding protein